MQFPLKSKRRMLLNRKWAYLVLGAALLGVVRAEEAVIYGSTAETAPVIKTSSKGIPLISINDRPVAGPGVPDEPVHSSYPWKERIVTTTFWIGHDISTYNATTNYKSAWDANWTQSFGGTDNPTERFGFLPKGCFAVTQNPFYVALPFNDVKYPELARKWVPWYNKEFARDHTYVSQCKGRWIEIRNRNGKSCFAQWQDVGPFRYDHAAYVFGKDRPSTYNKAGLDVSPAVKTFLDLDGLDLCDWRFVEAPEVSDGPWITYGEQAIVLAAIKQREQDKKTSARVSRPASIVRE